MTGEQHDDHIWLTVEGSAWAIRRIERVPPDCWCIHLWRGYEPRIEYARVFIADDDVHVYANAAAMWLKAGRA